jgi:hypothetical protein
MEYEDSYFFIACVIQMNGEKKCGIFNRGELVSAISSCYCNRKLTDCTGYEVSRVVTAALWKGADGESSTAENVRSDIPPVNRTENVRLC